MKQTMLALILVLTVASWAQTTTQTAPTPQQNTAPAEKGKCACCDKMTSGDAKDAPSCCAHHMKGSADMKMDSCCGGKDAKSCTNAKENAASCCKDGCGKDKASSAQCGEKCGKHCETGCCSSKKSEKAANDCCRKPLHS